MRRTPKLLRTEKSLAVFELDRVSELTDSLLDSLPWPHGGSQLAFRFRGPMEDVPEALCRNVSPRYVTRIGYVGRSRGIRVPAGGEAPGVRLQIPDDLDSLKALTRRTLLESFYEPWRERLSPDFPKEVEAFLSSHLSCARSAWVVSREGRVGLINLMRHCDCLGRPLDHIAWVWIHESLSKDERQSARRQLALWLQGVAKDWIQAFVHPFNVHSIRFIARLGFEPACVHVSRHL
ncbi:MAG: hypothetical protein WC728_00710 [Elusimicrobiota bacterium]